MAMSESKGSIGPEYAAWCDENVNAYTTALSDVAAGHAQDIVSIVRTYLAEAGSELYDPRFKPGALEDAMSLAEDQIIIRTEDADDL